MYPFYRLSTVPKKRMVCGLIAFTTILAMTGGFVWKHHAQPQHLAETIPFVRTSVVDASLQKQNNTYAGEVRGRYESQLAFQVAGKIIKRHVELGSAVKAGDVLMQLDPRDLQQTVNNTAAQVYSAESQLKLAESNLHRYRQLYSQNAISRAQLDQYENTYEVAQATVRQSAAHYVQGSNQLDYSQLYADKDGVIAAIAAETGQVVSTGQTVLTIVQDGEREVEISVPENRLQELGQATELQVSFWALPGVTSTGSIREIAPIADAVTRTYKVRVRVLNPPPEIKLGMTASVTVADPANKQTLTVPLAAIYQTGDQPAVWIVTDEILTLRPVTVGQFGNSTVEITSGLFPGDRIVVAGVHTLHAGQKVRLRGETL